MRYLNRIIDRYLEEWKQESDRKPLLIRGARQVGKSCAVRHFGETFEYYLEVNFERDIDVAEFFSGNMNVHDTAENFGSFVSPIGKPISICPLYAISNIISKTLTSNPIA